MWEWEKDRWNVSLGLMLFLTKYGGSVLKRERAWGLSLGVVCDKLILPIAEIDQQCYNGNI